MTTVVTLWLPILGAAIAVFVASSVIHMVIKWHNPDYRKFDNEDEVRRAINATKPAPGMYTIPYCKEPGDFKKPEMQQKFTEGPVAFTMVRAPGMPSMGPMLGGWFMVNLFVAVVAAYVAGKAIQPGASFYAIARIVCAVTFAAYVVGGVSNGIWYGKPWRTAAKEMLDALIYGIVSGAAFGWLWPR